MKTIQYFIALLVVIAFTACTTNEIENSSRSTQCINMGWKFHLGDPDGEFYAENFDDSSWEKVSVPHTLQLTSMTLDMCEDDKTQPTFQRNVGWYRRPIEVTSDKSKKVFLEFEGAHQATDCWVNGQHVGHFAVSGYSPFHFDISDYLTFGKENQVTLMVDNRKSQVLPPDPGPFDYVLFSGLYRDVFLVQKSPVHITFDWEALKAGVNITTPTVDPICKNAVVDIKTVVRNTTAKAVQCVVVNKIIDARGVVVAKVKNQAEIVAGADFEFAQIVAMEDDVQLWDVDNPYLYKVKTEVLYNGTIVDEVVNNLGLRKFRLDPEQGFMLNEKPIELIGFNRHQHYPYVGDAVPNSLHYKDMLQFKELGFNTVRTAHYPQDNALIEACDQLGILVYEEAPTWTSISNNPLWWDNLEESARRMVRNHRNHPSVVIWGGGVNHRGYVPRVVTTIKQEDPVRLTASQSARWTGWQASGLTDINANMLYGPFVWDRSEPMFAMEGHAGPATVAEHKRDPKMVGILSWTAHAYHTFHPTHDKYQSTTDRTRSGAMTLFRLPKSTRQEVLWYPSEMKADPYLHIDTDWNKSTEKMVMYSNADYLKLYVNGRFYKTAKPSTAKEYEGLDSPPFHISTSNYRAGELKVVGYKDNKEWVSRTVYTPEDAAAIRLRVDDAGRTFVADGSDIMMVYAEIIDKNGMLIKDYKGNVNFSLEGEAKIIGDGLDIGANPMFVEFGVAPVMIQAGYHPDEITLTASCNGLASASAKLSITENVVPEVAKEYDFEHIRVDLGAKDQLVQFGWTAWSEDDNRASTTTLPILGGIKASIDTKSKDGVLRWLGEMNVIGKYGYAYGEGVLGIDKAGIVLSFDNLPKGTYKLKTWHHAPRTNTDLMDTNVDKLKKLRIHTLPYAHNIEVSVGGHKVVAASTNGKSMQYDEPGTSEIVFESTGDKTEIVYKDVNAKRGVWINAFELTEWDAALVN